MGYPGWLYPLAWLGALFMSTLISMFVYWRSEDLRKAFMLSLAWLKVAALILWLVGLDRPVLQVYLAREGVLTGGLTITANMLIALALLITNATVWAWPELSRELLGRREELPGVRA